jgi:L-iditol 2-dehydrogenase
MEPMSVAIHARNRASLAPNSTILVFGAGAVGLLTAAVAKASKAKAVIICDIQQDRVDFALANGFADAGFVVPMARPETLEAKLKYSQEVAAMARELEVGGKKVGEVDVCFECTGVESCVQSAIYVSTMNCTSPNTA